MKRSRFTEEQIIGILKEHQTGLGAKELCCKHGVNDASIYIYGLFPRCKPDFEAA
jgi:putative transposase